MRKPEPRALELGELDISHIKIDPRSRDDIPALLKGLQLIYTNTNRREQLFHRLEQPLRDKVDLTTGRPGMTLWRIFVLATLKQGLGCDFDRLQELAHEHRTLRQILGHSGDDESRDPMQTLVDNVSLLTPEVLAEINQLVVEVGHEVVKKTLATDNVMLIANRVTHIFVNIFSSFISYIVKTTVTRYLRIMSSAIGVSDPRRISSANRNCIAWWATHANSNPSMGYDRKHTAPCLVCSLRLDYGYRKHEP